MKIVKQLLKEFWIPFLISIVWVLYNIYGNNINKTWNLQNIVNIFGPTFFLLSWLTGQFFRVKKQTKVEDNFEKIEARFNNLLNNFETRTNAIMNHISGGDSFPYVMLASIDSNSNMAKLTIIHNGEYPLYDVNMRIVDLEKFDTIKNKLTLSNITLCDTNIKLGNLSPSYATMLQDWKIEGHVKQSYNIFFTSRNGGVTQSIRLLKKDGQWISATKVTNSNKDILYEQIDEKYPRNLSGDIDW